MIIKLFGIVEEIIGEKEIRISLKENTSILDLKAILLEKYPNLKDIKAFAFAINETYATDNEILKETDIVAIIPPVSGG